MGSGINAWLKRFSRVDVAGSQVAGVALFFYWTTGVWGDVALGHIYSSPERGSSLLSGIAVALLFRSAFRRWDVFRWLGRMTLVVALTHTFLPFDLWSLVSVLILSIAIAMEVLMRRSRTLARSVHSRLASVYGCDLGGDPATRNDSPPATGGAEHPTMRTPREMERLRGDNCECEAGRLSNAVVPEGRYHVLAPDLTPALAMNSRASGDASQREAGSASQSARAMTIPDSVASYIRVELRLIAGDLSISRYAMHYAVTMLHDVPVPEIATILERIIDAAMLRRSLEGGGATITVEDIRAARHDGKR